MTTLEVIIQTILFLLYTEQFFKQSPSFKLAYEQFYSSVNVILNWRANANNFRELLNIPSLSLQVAAISFLLFFLLSFIAKPPIEILVVIIVFFVGGLLLNSLFEWVFNHKESLKSFRPVIRISIVAIVLIVINFLLNDDYNEIIEIFQQNYNIHLDSKFDLIIKFIVGIIVIVLIAYLMIWIFAISVISSIFVVLVLTTFFAKFVINYVGRTGYYILLICIQILLWINFD